MKIGVSFEVDAELFASVPLVEGLNDDLARLDFSECSEGIDNIVVGVMSGDIDLKARPVRPPKLTKNVKIQNLFGENIELGNVIEFDVLIDQKIFRTRNIYRIKLEIIRGIIRIIDTISASPFPGMRIDNICVTRKIGALELGGRQLNTR